MKVVYNNIIPFKGFKCIALWPFIFVRKKAKDRFRDADKRHERIHGRQQCEMLFLLFYIWYGIEYIVRLVAYMSFKYAYYNVSFEQEAYMNQYVADYIDKRRPFAWLKFVFRRTFEK